MLALLNPDFSANMVAISYWSLAFLSSILATCCSGLISAEINFPQIQSTESLYFSILTLHGLVFVFYVLVPIGQGFLNWWFPGHLGLWDFDWPRINLGSLLGIEWSGAMVLLSWCGGGWIPGWTMYPPLSSCQESYLIDMIISGIHALGVFGLLSGLNTISSFNNLQIPYAKNELSVFSWSQLVSSLLFVGTIPSLALGLLGVLLDSTTGSGWFDPSGGGDPILYQILFWFFGHPEVYVVVLPSFGVISATLEANGGGIYGSQGLIASVTCLGVLGYLVYAHHMFTVDLECEVNLLFSSGTMAIAVPTGVNIYSWLLSHSSSSLNHQESCLPFICFIATFVGGGLTGIMLSSSTADILLHDTYFVVAHFHQVMAIAAFLGFTCGVHLLGWCSHGGALVLFTVGAMTIFLPLYFAGLSGIPRSVPSMAYDSSSFIPFGLIGYLFSVASISCFISFL